LLFCAGTVKAGTSWLYDYLREHPETHFRTIKELQYFDRLARGTLQGRIRKLGEETDRLQRDLVRGKTRWLLRQIGDRSEYAEVLKSGPEPTEGYLRYLTAGAGDKLLAGEMTPEYGLLSVEKMRAINALAPDVRWILLLRDPVSRLWSHVRMLVRRMKPAPESFAGACEVKFDEVLAGGALDVTERGDYAAIHGRLIEAVAPEKRLVMFYEHLMSPQGVRQVTDFLGLSAHPAPLDKVVHGGVAAEMPASLRARARDWLKPQYAFVAATFGLPAEWEDFPEFRSEVA
jgi:Sulfotransferase family